MKIRLGYIALVALLTFSSCTDDFLNEPERQDLVSPDVIFSSREAAEAALSGLLRNSRGQYTSTDAGNIGSMLFARSIKGNDLILSPSWFRFDYAHENREPTYRRPTFTWQFPYDIIGKLNSFIESCEQSTALSDNDKNYLNGQAYAFRAFMYFQLSLEFQHTYNLDPNAPAPPIYTSPSQTMEPMSTMKEMYDLILSDLDKAITKGSAERPNASYWNTTSANAVLAQVHQVMGNWQEASNAAKLAYGGNVEAALDANSYKNGFNDFEQSPEWIWSTPQQEDQSAYYWTAPFAFVDQFARGYKSVYINEDFVKEFSDTDVRNLFHLTGSGYKKYVTSKFVFDFSSDVPIIRTAEMILIDAEANYHLGNETEAHNILYTLQKNRDPQAVKSSNSGNDLLEEILLERRKELYCENGVEWFDAKRLQRGITRTGNHRVFVDLAPNDKRFVLKVPQKEIEANDLIDASVNTNR